MNSSTAIKPPRDFNSTATDSWPPNEPVMDMVAAAFGATTPSIRGERNWKSHKLKMAKRRARRNEVSKAARKRNRRK